MKRIPFAFSRKKSQQLETRTAVDVDTDAAADAKQPTAVVSSIGRGNITQREQPSIKVVTFPTVVAAPTTESSPKAIVKRPDIIMKTLGRGVPSTDNIDFKSFGDTDQQLSVREKMWYKNQAYLLTKQQEQHSQETSARVESNFDRHRYSPRGVDEIESDYQTSQGNFDYDYGDSSDDDDTRINLPRTSKKLDDKFAHTTQFSSCLENDTRSNLSSSLFGEDGTSCSNSSELFDGLAFDPAISRCKSTAESESIFTSLDDAASSSYVFEFVDDGYKHRRKYQLGVGHNPHLSRSRSIRKSSTNSTSTNVSTSMSNTEWSKRDHREKYSTDSTDFEEEYTECPLLQVFLDEVTGTYKDVKLALNQVLHAFCITHDDVDRVTEKLDDAKRELLDLCHDRGRKRRGQVLN